MEVRAGVMETAGAIRRDVKSLFDNFPCSVTTLRREDADLDELVNGTPSLAAPIYTKFRE